MNSKTVRGYLIVGTLIAGIAAYLRLMYPLLLKTNDDILLPLIYVALPPICGLMLTLAMYLLLYTLLLTLVFSGKVQLIDVYFFQFVRGENGSWRVQYLPAAERKVGTLPAPVPWEKETGDLQQRAQIVLY